MTVQTICNGIIQADMVLKTAIEAGLEDIRANPWLLDFALQFYLNDELTVKSYGLKILEEGKNFFLTNNVDVRLDVAATQAEAPTITITCADGQESWTTLGDTAETPSDRIDVSSIMAINPTLTFTPKSFDPTTGIIYLNSKQNTDDIYVGMRVLDTINSQHYPITDVNDDNSFVITCDPDDPPNLKKAQVVNASDLWIVQLESATHRESYSILVECQGDPINTIVLHSVLLFCLYRYKRDLLHKRGFENVGISKGKLIGPLSGGDVQLFFQRTINVTGHVTNTWPGDIKPAVQGVNLQILVDAVGSGLTFDDDAEGPDQTDQGWRVVDSDLDE